MNEGLIIYKSSQAGHSLSRVTTERERGRESEGVSGAREEQTWCSFATLRATEADTHT